MRGWGEHPPHLLIFFNPLTKADDPHGVPPHLKMKPPWKSKAPFHEIIPRKKPKKWKTVINTCVSLIKQQWNKVAEIQQKRDFLTWVIQNFGRKVKQFGRKYYITWLIYLANKLYNVKKISWFHFMPCIMKNCLVLLRNFVKKSVEQNSVQ